MPDFNKFFGDSTVKIVDPRETTLAFKALIFGLAGTGKTSIAASASKVPEMSPVLYVDFERGIMPAVEHGDLDNMTVVQPDTFMEFKSILNKINNADTLPFRTIVLDTVDKLQERVLEHWDSDANPYAKWANAYDQIIMTINALVKKDINVICLTHEAREAFESTGILSIAPSFEGKKSIQKLPSVFDILGRLSWEEVSEDEFIPVLTTKTAEDIIVKTRYSNIPSQLGNPTFTKLYKYIDEFRQAIREDEEE